MTMKRIEFMDTSFRDGFQSVFGARVATKDFLAPLEAALEAGTNYFEAGGGARFQSLFFYCNESAFDMMDSFRKTVGSKVNLQTLGQTSFLRMFHHLVPILHCLNLELKQE